MIILLDKLCSAFGVSGCEDEVRDIIIEYMKDKCDSVETDIMENVICFKKGYAANRKKIMLSAHMDEVGLMVSYITKEGYLKFNAVGGLDSRVLVSKNVVIGGNKVQGVIGAKPKHLIDKSNKTATKVKDTYIDIGADGEDDAKKYVSIGDYIFFDSEYVEFGNRMVKSKALDNRVGCYLLMMLAKETFPHDIYFTFTVQEEVGSRGASVLSYDIKPDFAVIVEGTTCSDVPGTVSHGFSTHMGKGPAISILDSGSYSNKDIAKLLCSTAEKNNIPHQRKQTTLGGNDAASIHTSVGGIKTGVVSVPCRYIHSPSSVASLSDIEETQKLLYHVLKEEESWNF